MKTNTSPKIDDFEEAFRVCRIAPGKYVGAHPLRLPIKYARGVYGGHTIAQSLLVGIQHLHDIGWENTIPVSFHTHFIRAGDSRVPMEYSVELFGDDIAKLSIIVSQNGKIRSTATAVMRRKEGKVEEKGEKIKEKIEENDKENVKKDGEKNGTNINHVSSTDSTPIINSQDSSINLPYLETSPPWLSRYHKNAPHELQQVHHTDYIRNAYPREYIEYHKEDHELEIEHANRWITIWSGINNAVLPEYVKEDVLQPLKVQPFMEDVFKQPHTGVPGFPRNMEIIPPEYQQLFRDPVFNYVGLANLSDSGFLTTLPRILRIPFNPSEDHPFLDHDESKDARHLLTLLMNVIHLFHFNAMSLDHHIYFHDGMEGLDIVKEWVGFLYQFKRVLNNRLLVRGFVHNSKGELAATVVQEGLTYFLVGVPDVVPHL